MTITIIGVGLIGGSMAIDLRTRKFADRILGVDDKPIHAFKAKKAGIVDEIVSLEQGIKEADLIIVAIPVSSTVSVIGKIMDLTDNQVVMDVCSTKRTIAEAIRNHPKRKQFVATHPMAGTEYSGPDAAITGLFDGKCTIICDPQDSNPEALEMVENLYNVLKMRVIYIESAQHDVHAAYVSHISHISSFALALTVLEQEKNEQRIFDLAGGGFESTVRLAKSSADMWSPIFIQNRENVLDVLGTYIGILEQFRESIKNDDAQEVRRLIIESNRIRRILK